MAKRKIRIPLPVETNALIRLSERVIKTHNDDGAGSVLNVLNMADMAAKTTVARQRHEAFEQMSRDMEAAYEARNLALGINKDQNSSPCSSRSSEG